MNQITSQKEIKLVSTFLTNVPTLWYIRYMFSRYVYYIRCLLRNSAILTVIFMIAGPGTLRAGQAPCEPGCSAHQPKMHQVHQASCCDTPGTRQVKMLSSNVRENHQAASSACEGTLCIDSSTDVRETALPASHSPDASAVSNVLLVSETTVFHSQPNASRQRYYPEKTTPIYVLTCAYLI